MTTFRERMVFSLARGIVDEEIQRPREPLQKQELHTVLANAREDVAGTAMILMESLRVQRRLERWLAVVIVLLVAVLAGLLFRWHRV